MQKTAMSSKRTAVSSIQVEHNIYFVGGFEYHDLIATDKIDVYNTINKTWEKPLKLPSARAFVSPVKSVSNVYFAGGVTNENCTKLYSTETHNYEWTEGCGPTVRSAIQVSIHNEILTVLGNFSADFYDINNKTWSHSEQLTTWMQGLSNGVLFVHEDLIVGIGGINQTTLDLYSGAWLFNSTTMKLSKFDNATTLSHSNVNFNFTVASDTVSVWLADRCLLHRLGTSDWTEIMLSDIIYTATLGYETFIVKSDGFTIFDWTSNTSNTTYDSDGIFNAFSVSDQIVLIKNDRLAVYDGSWTYVEVPTIQLVAPSFGQYILYDGGQFYKYNPATKSVTTQTSPRFGSILSIVAIDSTTFTAFAPSGFRIIFENDIATSYAVVQPAIIGQFAIGRDVFDLTMGVVWINITDNVWLEPQPFIPLVQSHDGTAIAVGPIRTQHQQIDVYDYTTGEWKDSVPYNFSMRFNGFCQATAFEDTLVLIPPLSGIFYFINMTSGATTTQQQSFLFTYGNYISFATIPIYNDVGYFLQSARNLMKITRDSITPISNDQTAAAWLHQMYNDNTRAVYMSTFENDPFNFGTFFNVLSYDYVSSSWNVFVLPQTQTRLFIAVAHNLLLTFGGDDKLTYTSIPSHGEWNSTAFKLDYNPTIIRTLDDGTVMIAGGRHPTLGFYNDEVMLLNVTKLLSNFDTTPQTVPIQTPDMSNEPTGISTGEIVAAIVVPVGVVVFGAVVLAVLLVKRNKRRKIAQSTTIGLATKYGEWFTPFEQLTFEEQLGQGGSGQVFKGKWKNTVVALKVSMTEANSTVIGELELMVQMRPHPNVVQLFGFSVNPETHSIILIIEYCAGGSLQTVLEDESVEISLNQKWQWMLGVAKGLAHLHSHNMVHRDVAARNVLLSHNEPKLTDFGLSRLVEDQNLHGTTKSELGPIRWMAPESLKSRIYSVKSGRSSRHF